MKWIKLRNEMCRLMSRVQRAEEKLESSNSLLREARTALANSVEAAKEREHQYSKYEAEVMEQIRELKARNTALRIALDAAQPWKSGEPR
ncbi:MAG: hypothetical protein KAJ19_28410 [Gammaproteobacteria bacterium]|nr:hypothetical protein [Gammaproteobacteria bacterium]